MSKINRSSKLDNVYYDIRGPILEQANKMEEAGERILKLNIGNPAPFGFEAPDDILKDVIKHIQVKDIYLGNGVSELIMLSMQALLNNGDEVLLPAPDYPLWTAAVNLSSGTAVHYRCDEQAGWFPDLQDIESKITKNTKAIVLINPNNPTGAVYSEALLNQVADLARKYNLIIFSDEIYDKILYDNAKHTC